MQRDEGTWQEVKPGRRGGAKEVQYEEGAEEVQFKKGRMEEEGAEGRKLER